MGFIDTMRSEGHAVESVCRVLREQGCQVAARTYRWWRTAAPAARTLTDALVCDAVRDAAWAVDHTGRRRMTPEGLYGRRKMTALVRRTLPDASPWGSRSGHEDLGFARGHARQGDPDHDPGQGRLSRGGPA